MLLREIVSISIAFTVINNYGKTGAVHILTLFGPPYHVACRRVL